MIPGSSASPAEGRLATRGRATVRTVRGWQLALLGLLLGGAVALLLPPSPAAAATITVTTNADDPGLTQASLRSAITSVNNGADANPNITANRTGAYGTNDTVNFAIPGAGVHTIQPATALPSITTTVNIDGYSQSGASVNTLAVGSDAVLLIELDGTNAGDSNGLNVAAASTTVQGLVVNRFQRSGIQVLTGGDGSVITGNFTGLNAAGTTALGNGLAGIRIDDAPSVTIGGTAAGARNVTSGNGGNGVFVNGANATGATVQGNYAGLNPAGTSALANGEAGIHIRAPNATVGGTAAGARNVASGNDGSGIFVRDDGAGTTIQGNYAGTNAAGTGAIPNGVSGIRDAGGSNVTIGGTVAGAGNLASGNTQYGIVVFTATSTGVKVQGNYVGIDAAGTAAIPNTLSGIRINDAPSVTVGGTVAGARNVVSGNAQNGILVEGTNSAGTTVQGNYVGTDVAGTAVLANAHAGIRVGDTANVTIGGTSAGAANLVSGNTLQGVVVATATATGAAIRGNAIFGNGGIGIDLGDDDGTANDVGDTDTGPNGLQNFPLLTSASVVGGQTRVLGTLNSAASATFTLDFYANAACDGSGNGEGQTYLGSGSVTTNGAGNGSFVVTGLTAATAGQVITATATDAGNNTSEFSACRALTTPGVTVTQSGGSTAVTEGGATDSFTVVLDAAPTADVTVTLSPVTQVTTTPSPSLTFTTANWNVPQTVTVTAVDDNVAEGAHSGSVGFTVASADTAYNGIAVPSVSVAITDNDTPGVTVSPTSGLVTTEAGGTATFTVTLNTVPTSNVTISVSSSNTAEGTVSPTTLTFQPDATALTPQTVTVTGRDDQVTDGDVAYTVVLGAATSADPAYNGVDPADVGVTNRDDDSSGSLGFTATAVQVQENAGQVVLTVQRTGAPRGPASSVVAPRVLSPVTVAYATADSTAQAGTDYVAQAGVLSFGVDETTKTIAVQILADAHVEGPEAFNVTLTNPTGGATLGVSTTVTVTILDTSLNPVKPSEDNTDKRRKLTEEQRQQRQHTNRGNRDDLHVEGNVVEVHQDEQPPYVTIANRDGLVKVILLCGGQCPTIRVGDYLEADGEKQHELLFEATDVSVKRPR